MGRPVTLFTGQWADLPFEVMCQKAKQFGYDGLEIACWGNHLDVFAAARDRTYVKEKLAILRRYNLVVQAISNHLAGQMVCDPNDARSDAFAPAFCRGKPEAKRRWAIQSMKASAQAARHLGVTVVNGFTGSSIWHLIYRFPPANEDMIEAGFRDFAQRWNPILDVFDRCGVRFALEVHPTEIAFDLHTARRALKAIGFRNTFGFNFDPSHLYWQMVDPVAFIRAFPDRIYHVHMKDAIRTFDGESGILGSYLNFGTPGRGWDFRSLGRGGIDFEAIIRALNAIGYTGPLSVEWEDAEMDREFGATESCRFVRNLDFPRSGRMFDEAFAETQKASRSQTR